MKAYRSVILSLIFMGLGFAGCEKKIQVVQRPEKIVSMREVIYDKVTYAQLESLWNQYNSAYPSEEAYANWMYAARYAGDPNYATLLENGIKLYPSTPKLLYLKSMMHHGQPQNLEAQDLLERAATLDPSYTDTWFALVIHYLERGEQEKMNVALRKILETGIITDEVIDFSYNMIAGLEKNAILITNGDNDTYPGWILTKVVGYRPDVRIVNMSLLNTDWYLRTIEAEGIPHPISSTALDSAKAAYLKKLSEQKNAPQEGEPFSDLLIERLVSACQNIGRPVYFAATLQHTKAVKHLLASGRDLGLATLVTPPRESDASQMKKNIMIWVRDFRTGGLNSWGLKYAGRSRAGKMLVINYAAALQSQMDRIVTLAPDSRLELFRWYRDHLVALIPTDQRVNLDRMWCRSNDIGEIRNWCRSMNLSK